MTQEKAGFFLPFLFYMIMKLNTKYERLMGFNGFDVEWFVNTADDIDLKTRDYFQLMNKQNNRSRLTAELLGLSARIEHIADTEEDSNEYNLLLADRQIIAKIIKKLHRPL